MVWKAVLKSRTGQVTSGTNFSEPGAHHLVCFPVQVVTGGACWAADFPSIERRVSHWRKLFKVTKQDD